MFSLLKDEKGNYSTPRTLLFLYSAFVMHVAIWEPEVLTEDMFTFLSLVFTLMTGWAGGARVMSYVAPSLTSLANRFGGHRPAPVANDPDVTASTDVSEMAKSEKPEIG